MNGFVLLRLRAHRLLIGAAVLSVLLTTCAVTALAAFSDAVGEAGIRLALQEQSAARTLIEVTADVEGEDRAALDHAVRAAVAGAYDGLPVVVKTVTRSRSYGLPEALRSSGPARGDDSDLTFLSTLDRAHVSMVDGVFPGRPTSGGPLPVALPEAAAAALKIRTGRLVTLSDRLRGSTLRVRVTGIFRPVDPTAPYWRVDPTAGRGVRTLSFTTYGPMLVDPRVFASGAVPAAEMAWQAHADFSAITTARFARVSAGVRAATQRLEHMSADGSIAASSELPGLLQELRRSLLVSRSTLLISASQLTLLAALSLLLVARMLTAERAEETAQLRARGGSRSRVAGLAATESLLLVVPAAVLAPFLNRPLMELLSGYGELGRTGVRLEAQPATAWGVAALTALVCGLSLVVPALRGPGSYAGEQAARRRQRALPGAVRAGADVGLGVVAVLAYWQLSRRGATTGALTTDTAGELGLDPVLVVAPAICLLAGAVLALRLLPLAARLGERRAARGRGLSASLVGWQLARRPDRGTSPVLLLVLALSISMFAIGENSSWISSQKDQADFAVGSDIRVTGSTTPPLGQGGVYDHLAGVAAVTPSSRTQVALPRERTATVLAMDTTAAAGIMRLRGDLAERPLAETLRTLRPADDSRARDAGFAVPPGTDRVRFAVRLESRDSHGRVKPSRVADRLWATFTDRYGVLYTFHLGEVTADGRAHTLYANLGAETGRARGAGPAGPVRITSLKAEYVMPQSGARHRLTIGTVDTVDGEGGVRHLVPQAGTTWTSQIRQFMDLSDVRGSHKAGSPGQTPRSGRDTLLAVDYDTGANSEPFLSYAASVTVSAVPPAPDTVPAAATEAFLRATNAKVGSKVLLDMGATKLSVRISATLKALPTTAAGSVASDGGAVLLDLRTASRVLSAMDLPGLEPDEWWVAVRPDASGRVASALRDRGDISSVIVRAEQRAEFQDDPLGAGPVSALPAAVLAAVVLALVGFGVSAIGAVRERLQDLARLHALGASRRSLIRVVAAEQGILVLIAAGSGALLGSWLTKMVVPSIVLTTRAESPVPGVLVELPSRPVGALLLLVTAVSLLIVVLMAGRFADPARALRGQGER
ncbi:FtsX-like permease family protein [Actinacidiphila sp. bgisy160]|uniref:ABC transporter permease n=1 Tax=Actinacidiphila sp. bgisy160 TaxID=3413796 RepID=UPI003D75E333